MARSSTGVTVTPITDPYVCGYVVSGPRGRVECIRVEPGDWHLFNAERDGKAVRIGSCHNGYWSHGTAMSLAGRFVKGHVSVAVTMPRGDG